MLRLTLDFPSTILVAREDPLVRLVFANTSAARLEIPNMDLNRDWPKLRLESLEGGQQLEFTPWVMWQKNRIKPIPYNEGDGPLVALEGHSVRSWEFSLSQRIDLPGCGLYRLWAEVPSDNGPVSSNVVELRVVPIYPVFSRFSYVHGGVSRTFQEGWIHRASPPQLHLRGLKLSAGLKQLRSFHVCDVADGVAPVLSVFPNGGSRFDLCLAWLDGNTFWAADIGADRVVRGPRGLQLPGKPQFILAPFWKAADTDDSSALVWCVSATDGARLLVVRSGEELEVVRVVELPLPKPVWCQGFHASDGSRYALLLVNENDALVLHRLDLGGDGTVTSSRLSRWSQRLLGIAAQMDEDDNIVGVVVGWESEDPKSPVVLSPWSVSWEGRFQAESSRVWDDLTGRTSGHLGLRVDTAGRPHALLAEEGGRWLYVGPSEQLRVSAPERVETIGEPILWFMGDGTIPVVLWHDREGGVRVVPLGEELPDFRGPDFVTPELL
jgi:hypothetical protein